MRAMGVYVRLGQYQDELIGRSDEQLEGIVTRYDAGTPGWLKLLHRFLPTDSNVEYLAARGILEERKEQAAESVTV